MSPRAWVLGTAVALSLGACDAPTIPARSGVYPFALQNAAGEHILHWPLGSVVRVAVAPGGSAFGNISSAADAGMAAWNAVALYGEYELRRVDSSADADVVVLGSDAPQPLDVSACPPSGAGLALTTFCLTPDESRLQVFPQAGGAPGHTTMLLTVLASTAADATTARRLVAHELGHVLGIGQHSPHAGDLMASPPVTDRPQPADVATVLALYHTPATIRP